MEHVLCAGVVQSALPVFTPVLCVGRVRCAPVSQRRKLRPEGVKGSLEGIAGGVAERGLTAACLGQCTDHQE